MSWIATFAPDVGNLKPARAALGIALEESGVPATLIADALLVVTEMAGNAIRHARTDFTISVTCAGRILRFEVSDRDTRPPSLLGLDDESTSGRGLHLVAALATRWGWHAAEDEVGVSGKVVWAELAII